MTKIMARVNNGRRNMYDRIRAAENCGRLGAMLMQVLTIEDDTGQVGEAER